MGGGRDNGAVTPGAVGESRLSKSINKVLYHLFALK